LYKKPVIYGYGKIRIRYRRITNRDVEARLL
jgi:hypothetical protein